MIIKRDQQNNDNTMTAHVLSSICQKMKDSLENELVKVIPKDNFEIIVSFYSNYTQ